MNRLFCLALCLMSAAITVHGGSDERARWQNEARNAKIVRDNWGIAHVYGKSDADAVFGSLYAQAEDDFARIEHNFEADEPVYDFLVDKLNDAERLGALGTAVGALERDFGGWRVAWGEVNRFQRLTDDIVQPLDDAKPSLPVGFAPSRWGALASFDSSKPRSTRKIYGSVGNSFVAAVEFGTPVRAKAIMSGGQSGHPDSAHFTDQADLYSRGRFRDVLFVPEDVSAHAERTYHPGDPEPPPAAR